MEYKYKLVSSEDRTNEIKILRFAPCTNSMEYLPGQYTQIKLPDGKLYPFSIARTDLMELHIRHRKPDINTNNLLNYIEKTNEVTFIKAKGETILNNKTLKEKRDLFLIAGGTGFSHIFCLLEQLAKVKYEQKIFLFWGVKKIDDLYYLKELNKLLEDLKHADINIKFNIAVSDQNLNNFNAQLNKLKNDLIFCNKVFSEKNIADVILNSLNLTSDVKVFASGPFPMISDLKNKLNALNFKLDNFFSDLA